MIIFSSNLPEKYLQDALDAGGVVDVYLAENYQLQQPLTANMSADVRFCGPGAIYWDNCNIPLLTIGGGQNVRVAGLRAVGATSQPAICLPPTASVETLTIEDCDTHQSIQVLGGVARHLSIRHNYTGGGAVHGGIFVNALTPLESAEIVGNRVTGPIVFDPDVKGIKVSGLVERLLVQNNDVSGASNAGYDLDDCRYARVIGNVARECGNWTTLTGSGFVIKKGTRPDGDGLREIVFQGNTMQHCVRGADWRVPCAMIGNVFEQGREGLYMNCSVPGARVIGNVFHDMDTYAVRAPQARGVLFSGNRFDGCETSEAVLIFNGKNTVFRDNYFTNWRTDRAAIVLLYSCSNFLLDGNAFVNGGGWALHKTVEQTGIVLRDNWYEGVGIIE